MKKTFHDSSERTFSLWIAKLFARVWLAALLACSCASALAQTFPSRTVVLVVPFTTGTGIDILARVIGPKLAERWDQPQASRSGRATGAH